MSSGIILLELHIVQVYIKFLAIRSLLSFSKKCGPMELRESTTAQNEFVFKIFVIYDGDLLNVPDSIAVDILHGIIFNM